MNEFLLTLFQTTFTQLIGVLGVFFVFGFVLYQLQQYIQTQYRRTIGWKGILVTAWIGTPLHELSHAVVALLFGHRIEEVALFRPNKETGGLGHVRHSYGRFAVWGRIGQFFIGAAPMIVGSFFLALMFRFLLPNGDSVFVPLISDTGSLAIIFSSIKQTLLGLFRVEYFGMWSFWLFLYMSFCIASHIAPSKEDMKNMARGFGWMIGILLIVNALFLWFGVDITGFVLKVNHLLGVFVGIFSYALVISMLHAVVVSIVFFPFRK